MVMTLYAKTEFAFLGILVLSGIMFLAQAWLLWGMAEREANRYMALHSVKRRTLMATTLEYLKAKLEK